MTYFVAHRKCSSFLVNLFQIYLFVMRELYAELGIRVELTRIGIWPSKTTLIRSNNIDTYLKRKIYTIMNIELFVYNFVQ